MRLWSIHPRYLDAVGLVALWREGLLAKKVLIGETTGYRHHPQLTRFRLAGNPVPLIDRFLFAVWEEAGRRGYTFDRSKLGACRSRRRIVVNSMQLRYEKALLARKLRQRKRRQMVPRPSHKSIFPNPLFRVRRGPVESWEKRRQ